MWENGVKKVSYSNVEFEESEDDIIYIFSRLKDGIATRHSDMRLYSFDIKRGNDFIRKYIPVCEKNTERIGLLDLVEEKFYPNQGEGNDFIPGPNV